MLHQLDEAIRRGQAYRKAGADAVFLELKNSPAILQDLKRVTGEIDAPCLVNIRGLKRPITVYNVQHQHD